MRAEAASPSDPTLPVYVDPVNGSDETGDGKTWETALKTITNAVAKTNLGEYTRERRVRVTLAKGMYVVENKIQMGACTSLVGDPACDRSEIVLTVPDDWGGGSVVAFPGTPNGNYDTYLANLTISNVTISLNNHSTVSASGAGHDRWSKVVSNVVFTCCTTTAGFGACGMVTDGRTLVTDCLFTGLTGSVIIGRNGGWIRNCRFENCRSGGSLVSVWTSYWDARTVYNGVEGCTFTNNLHNGWAGTGGCVADMPIVRDCLFVDNVISGGEGGACYWKADDWFRTNTPPEVVNCTFVRNAAAGGGGAIMWKAARGTVRDCTFAGNVSYNGTQGGGGLYVKAAGGEAGDALTVRNCLFAGNALTNRTGTAAGSAVAVKVESGDSRVLLESCTVVSNRSAYGSASALYAVDAGTLSVTNTVVALNVGSDGAYAPAYAADSGFTAETASGVGYSLFHPQTAAAGLWTAGSHVTDTDAAPKFKAGTWIPAGAPLRDAGLVQDWMDGAYDLQRDADGNAFMPRVYGAAVDIGAFERENEGAVFIVR